jgi:transferase CAF17, mitochondrial
MPARFAKRTSIPFVCPRCQSRPERRKLLISARRLATFNSPSSRTQNLQYARLNSRSVIRLEGSDASEFLQGLIPAKLDNLPADAAGRPIYTAFLTAQGRISHDVFVYPPTGLSNHSGAWYIEAHAEAASELIKHLRKHKLRSKFKMERLPPDEMSVYSVWPLPNDMPSKDATSPSTSIGGLDPRPQMGLRWLMNPEMASKILQGLSGQTPQEVGLVDYTVHRMLNGIAEGQEEIIALSALPQETNIDFFDGIDFHKGCYLGQELTIRTHHTGVVRKRILPCQIYHEANPIDPSQDRPQYMPNTHIKQPIPGSNISKLVASSKRSTGKWLGGVGNIGLALCRLEMMTDISVTDEPSDFDPGVAFKVVPPKDSPDQGEVLVKTFVPPWLRAKIEESKARRTRKKPPKEGDDDVDAD